MFTTRLDGDQRPTVTKPDGELHVRDGQGLLRRHVLPQTGCDHHHVDEELLEDGGYPSSITRKITTTQGGALQHVPHNGRHPLQ